MSKKLRSKIISEINENRISTVEVCDILNKSGSIEGVTPLSPGQFAVGEAFMYMLARKVIMIYILRFPMLLKIVLFLSM